MSTEKMTVHIPSSLVERIQNRLAQTDFRNVDDYAAYILESVLNELEGNGKKKQDVFSKEDQEAVEDRLRNLGYM